MSNKILIGIVHFGDDLLLERLYNSIQVDLREHVRFICYNQEIPKNLKDKIIYHGPNEGFAKGMNRLIAYARQENIAVFVGLNNDCIILDDSITILANTVLESSIFLAQGLLLFENGLRVAQGRNHILKPFFFTFSQDRHALATTFNNLPELLATDFVCGAFFAINIKDNLAGIHDFDESFFCYMEDIELSERLVSLGHKIALVPKARAIHLESRASGGGYTRLGVKLRIHGLLTYLYLTKKSLSYRFLSWLIFLPRCLFLWIRDGMR